MKKWFLALPVVAFLSFSIGCDMDLSSTSSSSKLSQELQQAKNEADAAAAAAASSSSSGTQASSSSAKPASSSSSSSPSSGGAGGFIWKPVSESNGNLVVLLPSAYRGKARGATIRKGGSSLESGRFAGDNHNGNRPHYRFSRPGAAYGKGLTLVASTTSGSKSWSIPDGAKRTTY